MQLDKNFKTNKKKRETFEFHSFDDPVNSTIGHSQGKFLNAFTKCAVSLCLRAASFENACELEIRSRLLQPVGTFEPALNICHLQNCAWMAMS